MSVALKTTREPAALADEVPLWPIHRFTVKQYHRMIETGILTENDRVELLDGWILPKMPHNPPHDASVWLVQAQLLARVVSGWVVRIQSAITLPTSEPEPDVVIAVGPGRRYTRSHPRPRDIALVVEVADTTLSYDRDFKNRLYARARIPVYWIINLVERKVEVYTQPKTGKNSSYQQRIDYGADASVPLSLAEAELGVIAVQDLLP